MTHGKNTQHTPSLASARDTLCRLSTTGPWFWLAFPDAFKMFTTDCAQTAFRGATTFRVVTASRVVLFHGLPGFLVTLGEGGLGHG